MKPYPFEQGQVTWSYSDAFYPKKTGPGCVYSLIYLLLRLFSGELIFCPILKCQPHGGTKRVKEFQETNPGRLDPQETKARETMIC